tara:strand:- start:2833 stop:2955 length:123 start_codon:yes stop_codon:yes gene_type:complete
MYAPLLLLPEIHSPNKLLQQTAKQSGEVNVTRRIVRQPIS